MDEECDEAFVEKAQHIWEYQKKINAIAVPRLLAIARRCKSVQRIEAENEWLRERMDDLAKTNFAFPELQAENERLRKRNAELEPKPLWFDMLLGFKVIISEDVPDHEIWFATNEQLQEALDYSRKQIEQALKESKDEG